MRRLKRFHLEMPMVAGLVVGMAMLVAFLVIGIAEGLNPLHLLILVGVSVVTIVISLFLSYLWLEKVLKRILPPKR